MVCYVLALVLFILLILRGIKGSIIRYVCVIVFFTLIDRASTIPGMLDLKMSEEYTVIYKATTRALTQKQNKNATKRKERKTQKQILVPKRTGWTQTRREPISKTGA